MNETSKLSEMFIQPLMTGAIAGVGAAALGMNGTVSGIMSLPMFLGATSVAVL